MPRGSCRSKKTGQYIKCRNSAKSCKRGSARRGAPDMTCKALMQNNCQWPGTATWDDDFKRYEDKSIPAGDPKKPKFQGTNQVGKKFCKLIVPIETIERVKKTTDYNMHDVVPNLLKGMGLMKFDNGTLRPFNKKDMGCDGEDDSGYDLAKCQLKWLRSNETKGGVFMHKDNPKAYWAKGDPWVDDALCEMSNF